MGTIVATVLPSGEGIKLDIAFAASVTDVRVQRHDPGQFPIVIRSGESIPLTAGMRTVFDMEAPLDEAVYYTATQAAPPGAETATSNTVTVPSNGFSYLIHPGKPTLSCRLDHVQSLDVMGRKARVGLFNVLGRPTPVAVTDMRSTATGTLLATTWSANEAQTIRNVTADGSVLLLQTPAQADLGNLYIAVGDVSEARISSAYMLTERRFTIPFTVVDRPFGLAVVAEGYRWLDVFTSYGDWETFYDAANTWYEVLSQPAGGGGALRSRRRYLFPGRLRTP
jgi:hypothetical protein